MRVLITGSREHNNKSLIYEALYDLGAIHEWSGVPRFAKGFTIVHGGAAGADSLVDQICKDLGNTPEVHYAQWKALGLRAGPVRNQHMVDLGADICLAFPLNGEENKGTFGCIQKCLKAGIKVITFPSDPL